MEALRVSSLQPARWDQVHLEGGYLGRRIQVNREATLPVVAEQCERSGRFEALRQQWQPGEPNKPHPFWDSDVAKWLEAAARSLGTHPDASLQAQVDDIVDRFVAAQQPDGYLNTYYTTVDPDKRWSDLYRKHELYCAGHLIEAAVALDEALDDKRLLGAMCRYADYIGSVFGPAADQKRGYPGHQELELALIKLYHNTREQRYLDLAKFFIDERGQQPHYYDEEARQRGESPAKSLDTYDYLQAHKPVREQADIEGHAVRALYMLAGMIDVASETSDDQLLAACRRLWNSTTQRRMYITGGVGSAAIGERFTFDYDLPNEDAYAETCAAIALVFAAQRLLQVEPNREYADVMERALYNGLLAGVSLSGDRFFYVNPLTAHPEAARFKHSLYHVERQPFFGCSCCPTNIVRFLAAMGPYVYSTGDAELYVHLYADSRAELDVGGQRVTVVQETEYPWDELVRLSVTAESDAPLTIALRLPGWCDEPAVSINGEAVDVGTSVRHGYLHIQRVWRPGDQIELRLPMPPRFVEAHPRCRQTAGQVALERGPIVYCFEEVDNGPSLAALSVSPQDQPAARFEPALLGGVTVLSLPGRRRRDDDWSEDLYRRARDARTEAVTLTAVPYAHWGNRGLGEMRVWLARH